MKKMVLVTGASRGIGFAIASALLAEGYRVILCATKEEPPKTVLKMLENADARYIQADISNEEDIHRLYQEIEKEGKLYALVNNAGVAPIVRNDILQTTRESFDRVTRINLRGTFFMCQAFANLMIQQLKPTDFIPRIVNISSCSSYTSSPARGEYCISKAGISMVTKLFADRLSEYQIPVFEVSPGIIRSDMTECVRKSYEERIVAGLTPIRRMGEPEDVAKCVRALLSGDFDFCTGQVIHADGGFHLRRL